MLRVLDFVLRLAFFATVPFLATVVATLFPMTGVLVNIAATLLVFAFAEAARSRAERSPLLQRALARRFAFEAYYRENPPRPFLFYVFYPLLLPYVLARPLTRKELLLYRGFTGGGVVILVLAAAFDFYRHWLPELTFGEFIKVWTLLFVIQTLSIFVFLLPVSTTVVKLHSEKRLPELWVLLGAAAISVGLAVVGRVQHRGHIVSWVTGHRVMLRTAAVPDQARAAQLAAFYKPDESYAFSLHALPADAPEVVIIQCWIVGGGPPIWRAIRRDGTEITDKKDLPKGILGLKPRKDKKPGTKGKARRTAGSPSAPSPPPPSPGTPKKKK